MTPEDRRSTPAPVPFIVGCWRSGTTLLRSMFDAHPAMAVMYEWNVVVRLARHSARFFGPDGLDATQLVADLADSDHVAASGVQRDEIEAVLETPVVNAADAARRLLGMYGRHFGKPRSGEKSTSYVLDLAVVADVLPEARIIHIVRDGRDVALAATERGYGPPGVTGVAFAWRRHVKAGRSAGHALGTDRYIEVRYEDLVGDPEPVLRTLCEFIDLDFHPAMLRYHENADHLCSTTGDPERHVNLRLPPTIGLRNWRRELKDDDQALFAAVAGDVLREFGYEPGSPGRTVGPERLVASWARWRAWRHSVEARSGDA